jgi:hypothetical protein
MRQIKKRTEIESFVLFVGWSETESTWYVCRFLAYCTRPGL